MEFILQNLNSLLFGDCILIVGVENPIHSILLLIIAFVIGTIYFFMLNMDYFGLLFLIVYVGAIVVLFLFIVMLLEIKMINFSQRFRDFFSFSNIILAFFLVEVLCLKNEDYVTISLNTKLIENNAWYSFFSEANLYLDVGKLVHKSDHLRAIGGVLFMENKSGIMEAALLLFVSMVGSIIMALEKGHKSLKVQDANYQTMRSYFFLINNWISVTNYSTNKNVK